MQPATDGVATHALTTHAMATIGGETMGTTWSVKVVVSKHADLHALHAGIQGRLDQVVQQMSTWRSDSDIARYNQSMAGSWIRIPAEFFSVLACALGIAADTDGAFDPTIGPLVGLWGFGADARPQAPADAVDLVDVQAGIGWRRIELDSESHSVRQPGGMHLDLSAIAKGFGVDHVVAYLRESGIASALVEVGGELYGYGHKPDGSAWRVLVEAAPDTDDAGGEPRVLVLDGNAVATSGDRWHHYDVPGDDGNGRRYSHTIDPHSGQPVACALSTVTVVASDAMHADAWATALTVLGMDAGMQIAQRNGLAVRFLGIDADGPCERMSDAFRAHLHA